MDLSDTVLGIMMLVVFSLTLPLNSVSPLPQAFRDVPSRRLSSAMVLLGVGPSPWAPL